MANEIIAAFEAAFGLGRPFGKRSTGVSGVSDGNKGVQWNCWSNQRDGTDYLAVNLEGMQYDGRPIARFIEREVAHHRLMDVLGRMPLLAGLDVVWMRDAWAGGGSRLPIEEEFIGGTPRPLLGFPVEAWGDCLQEAWGCLSKTKNGRGRGRQTVTAAGRPRENFVSPHLQFRCPSLSTLLVSV